MGTDATIDPRMQAALARLTDNEKECLRRRLQQQTAKEMALELGVSPHAVEKRLKMARTKLGLSSSLDAARLLVAAEAYQQTGPQASDLPGALRSSQKRRHRQRAVGALIVILAVSAALALVAQSSGDAARNDVAPRPSPPGVAAIQAAEPTPQRGPNGQPITWRTFEPDELVEATPTEIAMSITTTFSTTDTDRSGFIEPDETLTREIELAREKGIIERPIFRRDENGNLEPTGEVSRTPVEQAQAQFIAQADTDKDGRWDFVEYRKWMTPILQQRGYPAEWRADTERTYARAD